MPKTKQATAEQLVADAIRKVAVKLNQAWESGTISSEMTVWKLEETLLMIAEELDPE